MRYAAGRYSEAFQSSYSFTLISPFSSCARFSAHSLIAVAALGARGYVVIRGRVRRVLLDGDKAFARVRGYLCDAAAIGACYHEHVGPPPKPLKSQIRDLQRALRRAEVPGWADELAKMLAQEKEEGAEEGARKVKEDWGDVDEEAWQVPRGGA